jgi:ParB-like chromosome segregation protein Spo0J
MTQSSAAAAQAAFDQLPAWNVARMVPVTNIEFCDWNVNEMDDAEFSELVAEIDEGGFDEPVQLIPLPGQKDRYLVPGGEHRVRAAIALEMPEIPAVLKAHLTEADEADVQMWSVKRNNVRGKINAQKYAKLERSLNEKHQIAAKAARDRMFVRGELLKNLKKKAVIDDDGPLDNSPPDGESGKDKTAPEQDPQDLIKNKKNLLAALKAAEEEVLLQSADTVEHGYLFFVQGEANQTHLIVDESSDLFALVDLMVSQCKRDAKAVDAFLVSALQAALDASEE